MGSETLGLSSASQLQSRVSLGREKEWVTNYTAGPERMQGTGSRRPPLASSAPPGLPRRPFISWFQEHVWVLPALFVPEARFSGDWLSRVGARGRRARVPQRPGLLGFGRGLEVPVLSRRVPRPQASGRWQPRQRLGVRCLEEAVLGEDGCFPGLQPLREPTPQPLAPRCWESRWWPRAGRRAAQTAASPQRRAGVIHPSNGLGCGEWGRLWGADQQDRKSTAADLPHPPGPRALLASSSPYG